MKEALILSDLLTWCLQIALLVVVAALVPVVCRLSVPKARLAFWQLVLLACLLLPFIRSWKQETILFAVNTAAPVSIAPEVATAASTSFPISSAVLLILATGAAARFVWLLTGFRRMRRYRRNSMALTPVASWGTEADLRLSEDVKSPVTFGFLNPVVLLPLHFPELDDATQEAILCHEIIHVRRKDWLFTVAEELLRTALWFHPAIWWVLGEIQLAREQTVDLEAIGMTRSRDKYVDALLAIAGAGQQTNLVSAPLFLRRRHLKQRVVSILKEVHMSKTRSVSALAASVVMLAASCWFVTGAIPLYGAPQMVSDGAGVAVETNGAQLMHRNSVPYPPEAASGRIEGVVTAQVKLDGKGNVTDASILSGPEELRKGVLQSVLTWHFARREANAVRQVSVTFQLPKNIAAVNAVPEAPRPASVRIGDFAMGPGRPAAAPSTLKSIDFLGSEQARSELMALLPAHAGDIVTPELASRTMMAVRDYDEHLRASFRSISPVEMQLVIVPVADALSPAVADGPKIKVGGKVALANLLTKVDAAYPPLAKAARVQGTVRFEASIGTDGHIMSLQLLSGPPLLVQAAMQAVQQWVYRPTLLNGNPVQVITTVDVNFTLEQLEQ